MLDFLWNENKDNMIVKRLTKKKGLNKKET